MKNRHAKDSDIQNYLFDSMTCDAQMIKHINTCEECLYKVQSYSELVQFIEIENDPVLDFDMAQLILRQIPTQKKMHFKFNYLINVSLFLVVSFIILTFYSIKETIVYLINSTFNDQIFLLVSTIIFGSALLLIDLFIAFNKKMKIVNSQLVS